MLPAKNRLKKSREFARVRRYGRSSGSGLAAVYVLSSRSADVHIGFSVSKRVGKAVTRNRVKRRFREATRRHIGALQPGQDLVFIARPASAGASYQDIVQVVDRLLEKTGVARTRMLSTQNA
ncbi:MAG: ribonuclease P protein component [Chloroflexota bacterium]